MAEQGNQDECISQFIAVTGTDEDRAKFFLQSSQWKLDIALASFFDAGDDDMMDEDPVPQNTVDAPPPPQEEPAPPKAKKKPEPSRGSSRFVTVSDLRHGAEEDEDSGEEGQRFYTGGADHGSGQQVVGPRRKKTNNLVSDIFKSAKEHGAEELSPSAQPTTSRGSGNVVFRGAGYRLGETPSDSSQAVPGTAGTLPSAKPRERHVKLKLWKNGFSLDDGPLRKYSENVEFLDSVRKGEIPSELLREANGGEVNLDLEDHKEEEYTQPKQQVRAFTGHGYMLGSPTPKISNPEPAPPLSEPGRSITIDPSQPVTSLQIRLADGTRLKQQFNHSHTIGDVRHFVQTANPSCTSFNIMTTFPNKVLTDDSQTLADAKLINAVIVQRKI